MALTEIQLPIALLPGEKYSFYNVIQTTAADLSASMHRFKLVADFINRMDVADLDAMGVALGQVRTDLVNFKTLLNHFVALWQNQAVTPTVNPQTVVDALRKINQG